MLLVPCRPEDLERLRRAWTEEHARSVLILRPQPASPEPGAGPAALQVFFAGPDGLAEARSTEVAVMDPTWLSPSAPVGEPLQPPEPPRELTMEERIGTLTARELEVATLAAQGLRISVIAKKLFVTERTVKFHLINSYRKLGVRGALELTPIASLLVRDGSAPGQP